MTNTVAHPDRVPGLPDSQRASPQTLRSLSGLRPHPESAPTWDDSSGYTSTIIPGISLNGLHKYAWNKGVNPSPKTEKSIPMTRDPKPQPDIQVYVSLTAQCFLKSEIIDCM